MRATSEGERSRPFRAAAGLVAAMLALGGCQGVGEAVNPWQGKETEPAEGPPTPTGPGGEESGPQPGFDPDAVLSEPLPPPEGYGETPGAAGRRPVIDVPVTGTWGRRGPEGESVFPGPLPDGRSMIRVGLLLPLSGPHAEIGRSLLNAAELALFSVARSDLALLPVDTGGTPEGAATAAWRAIDQGAQLILGPLFAASVKAAAPVARSRGVQVVSFSNDRTVAGDGVYVMGFAPEAQIRRVVTYAGSRGVKRLAAIVPDGPFGDLVEQTLYALTPYLGIEITAMLRQAGSTTDELAPVVKRLARYDERRGRLLARRRALKGRTDEASRRTLAQLEHMDTLGDVDFDAVFLPQSGETLRALAPLLPFYDIDTRKVRTLGTMAWDDPILATEPALIGGWFPAPAPAARRAFEDAYAKTYGKDPPRIASLAYDAAALAAVIARRAEPSAGPGSVASTEATPPFGRSATGAVYSIEALTAANGFVGADGIFRLLPSGLVERELAVMEVRERRFEVVSPAPTAFGRFGN